MRLIVAAREANESEPPVKLSHPPLAPTPTPKKTSNVRSSTANTAEGDVLAALVPAL